MSGIPPSSGLEIERVINGGFCVGCGACAVLDASPMRISLNAYGQYQALPVRTLTAAESPSSVSRVCPFSNNIPNEDDIAERLFGKHCGHHPRIGYHLKCYAGYVVEEDFHAMGSSGGLGSWLAVELLRRRMIDAVIHVQPRTHANPAEPLFKMTISRSEDEVRRGAKSRYYPVEMSEVLMDMKSTPGRYALVGLPCFIKAARLLASEDPVFRERLAFCIGLVCGHLKSSRFTDMLSWQMGVPPGELLAIDYRHKLPGCTADQYGIAITGSAKPEVRHIKPSNQYYGYNWGYGLFQYNACNYCDDVVAETADVVLGDAWLSRYSHTGAGTNVVVVRNGEVAGLLREAATKQRIRVEAISAGDVVMSQDAGLRHRREGLAYRLYLKDIRGEWRPNKRVTASHAHLDDRTKRKLELRMVLSARSHEAFEEALTAGELGVFKALMDPHIAAYEALYKRGVWHRVAGRVLNGLGRVRARVRRFLHHEKR